MVAGAYAYFHFKFTEYKFVDFSQLNLFHNRQLFDPQDKRYMMVIYSSQATRDMQERLDYLVGQSSETVLAIDIHQRVLEPNENIIHLIGSMNTILQVVQRFNIYNVPSVFFIKKHNNVLYKQDSAIEVLTDS